MPGTSSGVPHLLCGKKFKLKEYLDIHKRTDSADKVLDNAAKGRLNASTSVSTRSRQFERSTA